MAADLVGCRLGPYTVRSELGRGGMGIVYEAFDEVLRRRVALKVIGEDVCTQTEYVQRFLREARLAAKLSHPNLVTIYAAGEQDGRHYIAMEYIEGGSVKDLLAKRSRLSEAEALLVCEQAAAGLAVLHEADIVHRDIKPANLLIDTKSRVKITDYGLAKTLAPGSTQLTVGLSAAGSIPFMSPEQCQGGHAQPASDVYALGATLFQLVTGTPHSKSRTLSELAHDQRSGTPIIDLLRRTSVSQELSAFIARMMVFDPKERFADGSALLEEIGRLRQSRDSSEPATRHADSGPDADTLPSSSIVAARPLGRGPANLGTWLWNGIPLVVFTFVLAWFGGSNDTGVAGAVWHSLRDTAWLTAPDIEPSPRIVLIDIAAWPPSVEDLNCLFAALAGCEPVAVAVDVILDHSSRLDYPAQLKTSFSEIGTLVLLGVLDNDQFEVPIDELRGLADGLGYGNIAKDWDGTVRTMRLYRDAGPTARVEAFCLAVARHIGGLPPEAPPETAAINYSSVRKLPLLDWKAGSGQIEEIARKWDHFFRGAVVIVGSAGAEDSYVVPLWDERRAISGLVLQGVLLQNVLAGAWLSCPPWWTVLPGLCFLWFIAYVAGRRCPRRFLGVSCILGVSGYLGMTVITMALFQAVTPTLVPLAGLCGAILVGAWRGSK